MTFFLLCFSVSTNTKWALLEMSSLTNRNRSRTFHPEHAPKNENFIYRRCNSHGAVFAIHFFYIYFLLYKTEAASDNNNYRRCSCWIWKVKKKVAILSPCCVCAATSSRWRLRFQAVNPSLSYWNHFVGRAPPAAIRTTCQPAILLAAYASTKFSSRTWSIKSGKFGTPGVAERGIEFALDTSCTSCFLHTFTHTCSQMAVM